MRFKASVAEVSDVTHMGFFVMISMTGVVLSFKNYMSMVCILCRVCGSSYLASKFSATSLYAISFAYHHPERQ